MDGQSASKSAPHQLSADEMGGMSPSRTKNKTCSRADDLLVSQWPACNCIFSAINRGSSFPEKRVKKGILVGRWVGTPLPETVIVAVLATETFSRLTMFYKVLVPMKTF